MSNKASVQSHNCTPPQASAVDREKLNLSVRWGCLLLADRGYFDRDYLLELTEAGASFVIRVRKGLIQRCWRPYRQRQRIRQFCGKPHGA
ncbi:MAG: transposase [Gammaproteobacteria bacterium]